MARVTVDMGTDVKKETLQILHLEDNSHDTELIRALLVNEGVRCSIRRVESKGEFEHALDSANWHVIISDYSLPSYDGLKALDYAREKANGIPFILFSGTIGEETAVESLKRGATDYVLKQRPERLITAMRSAIKDLEEKERRKQAEEELRKVEEHNRLLEAQCLRMQRMESIGALVGGIAHDLNNALVPILVGVDYLHTESMPADSKHMLATMRASARRGADMIRQVLAFARGSERRDAAIKIDILVREMEKIVNDVFPKAIRCRTKIPRDLWAISGSATQLHQVLMNLCVNARDAMPSGGNLALSLQNTMLNENHARVQTDARPGPYVQLTVADTGSGMTPEVLEKIFQPFFTTKDPGKGTGLGLSTTVGIVKAHGGFITVKSQPGEGSEFNVFLPALQTSEPAVLEQQAGNITLGAGELILVIDDESAICEITKITLENYGYRVIAAGSGPEGVAAYAEHRADIRLALIDSAMPFMDGRSTCLALRKINPQLKVIGASGSSHDEDDSELRARVNAFIQKPYTVEKLLTTVHQVLTGKPV